MFFMSVACIALPNSKPKNKNGVHSLCRDCTLQSYETSYGRRCPVRDWPTMDNLWFKHGMIKCHVLLQKSNWRANRQQKRVNELWFILSH